MSAGPVALADLLAGRRPAATPSDGGTLVRTVVLDDDPTGTQCVRDVPVITSWADGDVAWAYERSATGPFILTNSRSLDPVTAAARTADATRAAVRVARARGEQLRVLSRGDSTLRGHFPLEPDVVLDILGGGRGGITVLAPAFPAAGRITVDAVHWLVAGGTATPVGLTEYAKDATFGYAESDLRRWVRARSGPVEVRWVPLDLLRGPVEDTAAVLRATPDGGTVVVDAVVESDLDRLAAAVRLAESDRTVVTRGGPSLARALLGQAPPPPLSDELLRDRLSGRSGSGLVVVGSHVDTSTRQLDRLRGSTRVVLDVDDLVDGRADPALCARRVVAALRTGDTVLSTSRALRRGRDGEDSLAIARTVAAALVAVTRAVLTECDPAWLLGKGGITASDLVTRTLGMARAVVVGQLLPGLVPVWQAMSGSHAGRVCGIFPGNVGDQDALVTAVARLRAATSAPGSVPPAGPGPRRSPPAAP